MNKNLTIDSMLEIDDNGMPKAPTIRQLLNKNIQKLYSRDKSKDKEQYIKECIVIYYLGDPKSPARSSGLSDAESLTMAIQQAGLPSNYIPDELVLHLIKEYYNENITEAGRVIENIMQSIHNMNLMVTQMNNLLCEKLKGSITVEDCANYSAIMKQISNIAGDLPTMDKKLKEAKEILLYEKNVQSARGGIVVTSSMDAEEYMNEE
jgi:hypothetical protein